VRTLGWCCHRRGRSIGFDLQVADLSVDHAGLLQEYR
jgi:hypothetical protein